MAALCRTADIVGMTTTGAAKNRLMLESLKPKIGKEISYNLLQYISHYSLLCVVIVEEAAPVLESHVVSSLTPDCQQ